MNDVCFEVVGDLCRQGADKTSLEEIVDAFEKTWPVAQKCGLTEVGLLNLLIELKMDYKRTFLSVWSQLKAAGLPVRELRNGYKEESQRG